MKLTKRLITRIIVLLSVVAILVIGMVIIATLPSGAKSLDISAQLSEILGIVEARNSAQDNFNQVSDGFILKSLMQLQTKQESRVRLDLSTGTIVRLGPVTIFSLDPPASGTGGVLSRIELQVGKVWIVLKGGSLDVNTPGGVASVRGSYLSVWVEPNTNRITVTCLEGHCGFKNNAGNVDLTSGQKIISTDANILPTIEMMNQADLQDWLDNCPEAAAIIPQIMPLLGLTTPTLTPTSTPTATPTSTPTSTPTATPNHNITATAYYRMLTATYSYLLTQTKTATPTVSPTPTYVRHSLATNTPTEPPSGSNPPPPTQAPPPPPTQAPPPPPPPTQVPPPPPPPATETQSPYP
jgi:FecR protein